MDVTCQKLEEFWVFSYSFYLLYFNFFFYSPAIGTLKHGDTLLISLFSHFTTTMAHDEYKKVNAINVYYMHNEESDPKAMMI